VKNKQDSHKKKGLKKALLDSTNEWVAKGAFLPKLTARKRKPNFA